MGRRTSHRGKLGGRTVNRAEVRDALEDGRVHCAVGLVVHRPNEDSHFEIIEDDSGNPVDVSVEVDLMPRQEAVTARLGALAGGPGGGIWRVPPPGSEVLVCIPRGELENGPVIVADLSSRSLPSTVSQDDLVIINPVGKVIIESKGDISVTSDQGNINLTATQGNVTVQSQTGSVTVTAPAGVGSVKLGPVGTLPVLVQGTVDSLGFPVTQNPAASATIVKAG